MKTNDTNDVPVDENNARMLTSGRRVPMEGAVNFRDIGGYHTADGRQVKRGRVYRSDGLARLTKKDHETLHRIGLRRVFDFRTPAEVSASPDHLPEDDAIEYVNLPVRHGAIDFTVAMKRLQQGDVSWLTPDFMVDGYIRNLEEYPEVWGQVINYLADSSDHHAVLFHCTGGKDRTGTCAALILLMLGVDEEAVINDHQLSNGYIAHMLPDIYRLIASYGIDPDLLVPYFTAPREGIVTVLSHIRDTYGSASGYLSEKAGVNKETQALLREKLLR
ncbi:MAG: tyrosine-protein phosphatase [Desulfosalsimonadaceae bacterium]